MALVISSASVLIFQSPALPGARSDDRCRAVGGEKSLTINPLYYKSDSCAGSYRFESRWWSASLRAGVAHRADGDCGCASDPEGV